MLLHILFTVVSCLLAYLTPSFGQQTAKAESRSFGTPEYGGFTPLSFSNAITHPSYGGGGAASNIGLNSGYGNYGGANFGAQPGGGYGLGVGIPAGFAGSYGGGYGAGYAGTGYGGAAGYGGGAAGYGGAIGYSPNFAGGYNSVPGYTSGIYDNGLQHAAPQSFSNFNQAHFNGMSNFAGFAGTYPGYQGIPSYSFQRPIHVSNSLGGLPSQAIGGYGLHTDYGGNYGSTAGSYNGYAMPPYK